MEIATKDDFEKFKNELLHEVRNIINTPAQVVRFLKSAEVRDLFHISETKLYELRRDGKIPFLKVDGKYLYEYHEVLNAFKPQSND
jgi:hypothetical protein